MSLFKRLFNSKDDKVVSNVGENDSKPESYDQIPWMTDIRRRSLSICQGAQFKVSVSLPTEFERELRPTMEIANRLHAIKALVLWLMVPEDNLPSDEIMDFVDRNQLRNSMTDEEMEVLKVSRDDEEARNLIGWKFENSWPLAWYFGYLEPDIHGLMMTGEQMQEILVNHTCPIDKEVEEWVASKEILLEERVVQMEDVFYCLHNAVRSAQLGERTVPDDFDPMGNGGVIHERRHSLTWMLSKGVAWEETDLST